MARLFIIGNGFDLSHGLKTSYKDFKDFLYQESFKMEDFYKFRKKSEELKNLIEDLEEEKISKIGETLNIDLQSEWDGNASKH